MQAIENGTDPSCSYWDETLDSKEVMLYIYIDPVLLCVLDGFGDWSSEGCSRNMTYNESQTAVTCYCTHLTSFSILLVRLFTLFHSPFILNIYL